MKRMDLFCTSPSSTAICSSMDLRSVVRHGTTRPLNNHHHRGHHRSHHILHDHRRSTRASAAPCSSQLPINPRPYTQKSRKSSSKEISNSSPPGSSSRYLLSDTPFFALLSDSDHHVSTALVPTQVAKTQPLVLSSSNDDPPLKSSLSTRAREQIVVLRVSLHCKGCEGKVRKHISRMEGVRSFTIDFEDKKVTIIGNLSPLAVLASVSKVKNAQFWPSPSSSSPSPSLAMVNYSH